MFIWTGEVLTINEMWVFELVTWLHAIRRMKVWSGSVASNDSVPNKVMQQTSNRQNNQYFVFLLLFLFLYLPIVHLIPFIINIIFIFIIFIYIFFT